MTALLRCHCMPILLAALALPIALAQPTLSHAGLPTDAEAKALIQTQLIDKKLAKGVAVALVDRDGIRVVTAGEARDGVPLKAGDLFEIGSITKTFTGTLLAIAAEKGEVTLDDPVEKFLPNGLKLRDRNGDPLRLVDVATQRSGLPRLADNMLPRDPKNPYADYTEENLLDFIRNVKVTRARDEAYEYSNIGFGILGYVLTRAAKAPDYAALVRERIFDPLKMANSTADVSQWRDRLTQPHDGAGRPTTIWDLPLAHAGAGAIRSTAGDMGRYVEAIAGLRNTPLDKALTLAITGRAQGPGAINPIGLAFMRVPLNERSLVNHDGGTFGSSSSLFVDPVTKEGVFVVANTSVRLFDIALHLLDRRYPLPASDFPKTAAVPAATLARYAGTYKLTDTMNIVIRVRDGKVTAQATGQGEFELFPESETKFFAKVTPLNITFGEIAAGADGKAGSFLLEQRGVRRTGKRVE